VEADKKNNVNYIQKPFPESEDKFNLPFAKFIPDWGHPEEQPIVFPTGANLPLHNPSI
jgi:hypothetical protein